MVYELKAVLPLQMLKRNKKYCLYSLNIPLQLAIGIHAHKATVVSSLEIIQQRTAA